MCFDMQKVMSEARLLEASLAGNKEAFGTIVQRYQSLICGIAYSATGDFAKSEELAQETFINAWKGLRQLKDLGKFRAWLCTIARNVVSRSINRQQKGINQAQSLEKLDAVEAVQPGPGQIAISKEHEAVVWLALKEIPQKYREPLVLFYREQQSVEQVAAGLGLSEPAVRQRLSRGRKLLKAEVAALVEDVLGQTGPTKTFGIAVISALPALAPQAIAAGTAAVAAKGSAAAKTIFATLLSGAIMGPIIGLLGGLFGSWMSIKNTRSRRERRFMINMAVTGWSLLLLLIFLPLVLALTGVIPKWSYWCSFTVFFALLVPSIIWGNARQRRIQIEDGTYIKLEYHPLKMSKGNIYGVFVGCIFGPMCWLIVMSFVTKDWLISLSTVTFAVLLFVASTKICLRWRGKYWRIVITDLIGMALFTLVVVNLRWGRWVEYYERRSPNCGLSNTPPWAVNLILGAIFAGLLILLVLRCKREQRLAQDELRGDFGK